MVNEPKTQEHIRLAEARAGVAAWRRWGPYLSERQWGTVREDYSADGNAWDHFSHDHARSRAYQWGEDGIAGWCDERMLLCFSLGLWNHADPILKERLFGLTNSEGNHGEDVKECYFYLDSVPSHSYMRMLYKYPQRPFPYAELVRVNRERSRDDLEYELIDTGIFEDDRYFDVTVEYAKATPEDLLIMISVTNRGPQTAPLTLLPQLCFRNTWWMAPDAPRPSLSLSLAEEDLPVVLAEHKELGARYLACPGAQEVLFTGNESNTERLFQIPNATPYVKDAFHRYLVEGHTSAVNPDRLGTKCTAVYRLSIASGATQVVRLRLSDAAPAAVHLGAVFDYTFARRRQEAEFYAAILPASPNEDKARVVRQGFAGMLWGKQAYFYDLQRWLADRGVDPYSRNRDSVRNSPWFHMASADVISMPDKWEYPWFAAWDLAFHSAALAVVDPDFARQQLHLMLEERYLHPNGQIPAYEWNFGDVNPPVHAWAAIFNYRFARSRDTDALRNLEQSFQKLLLNFTWWLNRKDHDGRNLFEGGFLGLDNISVFDRSAPLPNGGMLEQADGTAWMALYAQNMLEIALELACQNPVYEQFAIKFYNHFLSIAAAMNQVGEQQDEMWDEEDGFFYDVLRVPDGSAMRLKVRSVVGLLPLCAVTVFPEEILARLPTFAESALHITARRRAMIRNINPPERRGVNGRRMLSVFSEEKLRRVLTRLLDENEFLAAYGIRSMSRYHRDHPYLFRVGNDEYRVAYLPAESDFGLFGGNSNWRGPIWMPVNVLIVRALLQYYSFFGDDFRIECPTGSGRHMTLFEVSREIVNRLANIFLRGADGRRPVYGGTRKFQEDPHWRDHILFYEYFHGDNGAGIGASHQTGWTGLIAALICLYAHLTPERVAAVGIQAVLEEGPPSLGG
jgi:Glycosyl hydrolase family 63 C-terminal domain